MLHGGGRYPIWFLHTCADSIVFAVSGTLHVHGCWMVPYMLKAVIKSFGKSICKRDIYLRNQDGIGTKAALVRAGEV